ncbi:endonuclease/exonuclease/phosphatase family protein [uncultured Lacinutrix sp.]|uniref:endonuclease/exonuclease/phosphatase family protein n=1 Tax=uncultured Lacinutrix sp. TaxID=574032 RepID=UPI00261678F1|nr:endonuclease/exonuclease/phosphatase family protein [uncultured Lacinutrix sp.]
MKLNFFKSKETRHTIAFYNIENLFDVYDDEITRDNDMQPTAEKRWSIKRYKNKLCKIGYAISCIGEEDVKRHPAIVGLAEVENEAVLKDLVSSKHLDDLNYKFLHYNSPDERGIDVALLYDEKVFKIAYSKTFTVDLLDDDGEVDHTRDILLVSGLFEGLELHVIVNHWPSRRTGDVATEHKRMKASEKVTEVISMLKEKNSEAKIVVMGDFNDDPESNSLKALEASHGLFNPMRTLLSNDRGTTSFNHSWNLFDQFLITHNFFERKKNALRFVEANIFDADFLKEAEGKYKGTPYRTYVGKHYKGGYSDHFPVYMVISKK